MSTIIFTPYYTMTQDSDGDSILSGDKRARTRIAERLKKEYWIRHVFPYGENTSVVYESSGIEVRIMHLAAKQIADDVIIEMLAEDELQGIVYMDAGREESKTIHTAVVSFQQKFYDYLKELQLEDEVKAIVKEKVNVEEVRITPLRDNGYKTHYIDYYDIDGNAIEEYNYDINLDVIFGMARIGETPKVCDMWHNPLGNESTEGAMTININTELSEHLYNNRDENGNTWMERIVKSLKLSIPTTPINIYRSKVYGYEIARPTSPEAHPFSEEIVASTLSAVIDKSGWWPRTLKDGNAHPAQIIFYVGYEIEGWLVDEYGSGKPLKRAITEAVANYTELPVVFKGTKNHPRKVYSISIEDHNGVPMRCDDLMVHLSLKAGSLIDTYEE